MHSFLHLLARDLLQKRGDSLDRLTVVFPNKRAGLFLAKELTSLIKKPIWMPEIITLGEFIERGTGLKQAEELPLIIKLYQAYREASGIEESFDSFYYWGNMLLSDFDDIDKYLVDAGALFSNLVALKELEKNFPFLTPEQIEIIQQFWSTFHPDEYSEEQQSFLATWKHLYPTYSLFRKKLEAEGLCYEGMGQRLFCENPGNFPVDTPVVFAGFNALNFCEKQIFSHFRDNGNALFYWDYDLYYTANKQHEAGLYIRENLQLFPNALDLEHFNNFRYHAKSIEYIAFPTTIGQAKMLPELLKESAGDANHDYSDTAIVLCDERLLTPVIQSIPEEIRKINITMGYPARNTAVASLISLLGDLQQTARKGKENTYYYFKPVTALLNHPLILGSAPEQIQQFIRKTAFDNQVYLHERQLQLNELTTIIFSPEEEEMGLYLIRILSFLLQSPTLNQLQESLLEKEVIFHMLTRIRQINNYFKEEGIRPEDKLYLRMISKVLQGLSIPFSGEPLEGMQVMGLMETRMLDFRKLILLSVNESIIPKTSVASSFIPYTLRKGFNLPTPEHRDALFSYYFYRLLQRAEEISLLYTDAIQGMNTGEMSRFLYQMKYESGLPIRERYLQNRVAVKASPEIIIPRNEAIAGQLAGYSAENQRGISPSALNTYMDCRLKFYFRYVAKIREKEEIAEELDHRLLGNIFHETMQALYKPLLGREVGKTGITTLMENDPLIERLIREAYANVYDTEVASLLKSGSNELVLSVVRKYVKQVLSYDLTLAPFTPIALEETFRIPVEVPIANSDTCQRVYIEGNIDRIDRTADGIRVIDYKTGADKTTFKSLESLFDRENKQRNKGAFQTLLYCLMYTGKHPGCDSVSPGIYSTKLLFTENFSPILVCDNEPVYRFAPYAPEFETLLNELLYELFFSDTPFSQTESSDKCRNCPYSPICNR